MPIVSAIRGWKRRMDLSLFPCTGSGLAGRPSCKTRPTCRSQGSSRRSGRFPALPYPPLKQMGSVEPLVEVSSKGTFPVSVSLGAYRRGKGNGWSLRGSIELIASTIVSHRASLDQLSQAGANRCGAQAAELAQLLRDDRLIQAGQDLLDALKRRRFRTGIGNGSGVARHRESQR